MREEREIEPSLLRWLQRYLSDSYLNIIIKLIENNNNKIIYLNNYFFYKNIYVLFILFLT